MTKIRKGRRYQNKHHGNKGGKFQKIKKQKDLRTVASSKWNSERGDLCFLVRSLAELFDFLSYAHASF